MDWEHPKNNPTGRPHRRPVQSDIPHDDSESAVEPVAVVIVSWNSRDYLEGCLSSLERLQRPVDQIVVVDNGSTDGTPAWLAQRFPEVEVDRIRLAGAFGAHKLLFL